MPEMGGIEMIYHMRGNEATRDIPVVIVSTESSTTVIEGLLADGAKDYLHKPFTPEEFREVLTRTVGV
jgi:two-component system chemotaxis response regulator CheY